MIHIHIFPPIQLVDGKVKREILLNLRLSDQNSRYFIKTFMTADGVVTFVQCVIFKNPPKKRRVILVKCTKLRKIQTLTNCLHLLNNRTAEMVVSGDGNYASSSNGQCLLHVRSRLQQQLLSPQQQQQMASTNGTAAMMKKSLPVRSGEDVVKRTRSMNV